ncbi:hypothetical protein B0H14DRAFT_2649242 [Mycena olivaceomarginata]|nr:hypothetical protein B0H14DRAFT_2649242 [Mycena olivaceomarginata]
MRSIHHRNLQIGISDSHFVLLLPPSLFLPAAPVIDIGDTQPPTPALDRVEHPLDAASAVWQRRACPLCPSAWSYSSRAGHTLRAGNNTTAGVHTKCGGLPVLRGGTRRMQIWRTGVRHEGAHWVHMCTAVHWRDGTVTTELYITCTV